MTEGVDRCVSCKFFDRNNRFGYCRCANAARFGNYIPKVLPRCDKYEKVLEV